MPQDMSAQLQQQVVAAASNNTGLHIRGGGSKDFYGRQVNGEPLNTGEHQGVLNYEPTELVISARAGTRLSDIEQILAENNLIWRQCHPWRHHCLQSVRSTACLLRCRA